MPKLKEMQVNVLKSLDSRKKMTPAEVAEAVDSYPGPMARCLWKLHEMDLVNAAEKEEGYVYWRAADGTKAMKSGRID